MHRWIASAAGGTSQRLKPGPAMVRYFSKKSKLAMMVSPVDFDFPCRQLP